MFKEQKIEIYLTELLIITYTTDCLKLLQFVVNFAISWTNRVESISNKNVQKLVEVTIE